MLLFYSDKYADSTLHSSLPEPEMCYLKYKTNKLPVKVFTVGQSKVKGIILFPYLRFMDRYLCCIMSVPSHVCIKAV